MSQELKHKIEMKFKKRRRKKTAEMEFLNQPSSMAPDDYAVPRFSFISHVKKAPAEILPLASHPPRVAAAFVLTLLTAGFLLLLLNWSPPSTPPLLH
jgi:hypothetical protein